MSYDLFVFRGPTPRSGLEFTELLERFQAGDEAAFESSPKQRAFYENLLRKIPGSRGSARRLDPQSGLIVRP